MCYGIYRNIYFVYTAHSYRDWEAQNKFYRCGVI